MKKPVIISLGEVLWDLFPDREQFGGAPANFACHAALAGAEVTMVSAVGDDSRGREAMEILRAYKIDVTLLQVISDAPTGTVGVELDPNGKPTFTIHEDSAWDRLSGIDTLQAKVATADAVYFGTLGQRSELSRQTIRQCVSAAKDIGMVRILDINLRSPYFDHRMIRESVELASILKMSDDELVQVARALQISPAEPDQTLRQIRDTSSLDLVVMTRGAEGAILVSEEKTVVQPGIPVDVRDTVGAGDAFTAWFALGLLRCEEPAELLRKACEQAAHVCSLPGAVPPVSK